MLGSCPTPYLVRRFVLACTCLALLAVAGGAPATAQPEEPEPVPTPTVIGPIPVTEDSYPFFSAAFLTGPRGYVEEEYFIEGVARQYAGSSPGWVQAPGGPEAGTVLSEAPYRTRIVVRRPADPARFNGMVNAEWYNVTGGFEQEFEWMSSYEYLMRAGWIWVGVSNQTVGVEDLKRTMPERYADLSFPGDQYSADVYSQAAQALRAPADVDPLGGMRPEYVVASGHSQSGNNVAYYYNSIQPLHGVFDGFMPRGTEVLVEADRVRVPMLRTYTETESIEGPNARDVDGEFYRRWEVAGASHADWEQQVYRTELIERDRGGNTTPYACAQEPFSRIPFSYALSAAYDAMRAWLQDGTPPPISPRLEATPADTIVRDERGNALGGIRLPDHAVPTATNRGDNTGAGFCFLYGSYTPFDEATLRELYASQADYVARVRAAAQEVVDAGFMLAEDVGEVVDRAASADLGLPASIERYVGPDRAATAAAISAGVREVADVVVVASDRTYADALAGAPLAVHLDAPLLLSGRDALTPATADEIARLGASRAVLLGGESALGDGVVEALEDSGVATSRIGGANRFATAAAIAEALPATDEVVVAEGDNADAARGWPDALSASALAGSQGLPVLLATRDALPAETAAALGEQDAVVLVGGDAAISEDVAAEIDGRVGEVRRIAGATRYATSAAVADEVLAREGTPAVTWVATGRDHADGLVAAAAAAAQGGVLLLVDGAGLAGSPEASSWLSGRAADVRMIRIAGGAAAVSPEVEAELRALVGAA